MKERGAFTDWVTQQCVKVTGRRFRTPLLAWLDGSVGKTSGVGRGFFDELAKEQDLEIRRSGSRGLLQLEQLRSPGFDPDRVTPTVRAFYERTSEFEMESWSEWCGFCEPDEVRGDHVLRFFGLVFLRLHYRLRRRAR